MLLGQKGTSNCQENHIAGSRGPRDVLKKWQGDPDRGDPSQRLIQYGSPKCPQVARSLVDHCLPGAPPRFVAEFCHGSRTYVGNTMVSSPMVTPWFSRFPPMLLRLSNGGFGLLILRPPRRFLTHRRRHPQELTYSRPHTPTYATNLCTLHARINHAKTIAAGRTHRLIGERRIIFGNVASAIQMQCNPYMAISKQGGR